MSNKQTTRIEGDVYIAASSEPSIYGSGSLEIDGTLIVSGGISVTHSGLSGLLADDHTQYALLAGRTGGQTLIGGIAASNSLILRSTSNATKGQVYIDETTASTSVTTGALRVAGGVGIAGSLYAGDIYSNGVLVGSGSSYTAGTNIDITSSVISVVNNPSFSGVVSITNTTASSSTTTGSVIVSGGMGIAGAINAGSTVSGTVLTSTIATGTAPLVVASTTRVSNLNVATAGLADTVTTNANLTGPITSTGNATAVTSQTGTGTTFVMNTGPTVSALTATGLTTLGTSTQATVSATGVLTVSNTTASTSTTTGSVIVSGGMGIAGTLYANALVAPHSGLTGLTVDDHTQYALLVGRSGGQTLTGGTAASNVLTLRSTSNATKGQVFIDETTASNSTTTGALRVAGGIGIGGAINSASTISGTRLTSTIATGTAPLTVTSTTRVSNLNVATAGLADTVTTNANLTGPITSVGNATSIASQTGTGTTFVMNTGPTVSALTATGLTTLGTSTQATVSATGVLTVANTTASTSISTGALIVSGGVGISGTLYANALVAPHSGLTGLTADDHTQYALLVGRSGGQVLTGGTAASNVLTLRSTSNATKGQVYVDETTASTSTTTGAFRVAGGVGIAGSLYAGDIYSNGVLVGSSSYTAGTNIDITGSVISVVNNPSFSGVVSITNTTASTSSITGSLVLSGGLGVAGAINAGSTISATVLTSTIATGTAPLTVSSTTRVSNLNVATAGLADTVTTNANLTGPITSVGNATAVASQTGTGSTFVMNTGPTVSALTATGLTTLGTSTQATVSATGVLTIANTSALANNDINITGVEGAINVAGNITLYNATSNMIAFREVGVAAPTASSARSSGTKILLYPNVGATDVDYAIGIDTTTLWQSVPNSSTRFRWYGGTTAVASLTGAGVLSVIGATNLATTSGITTIGSSTALTISAAGVLTVANTTASTSVSTGSVIVAGGMGVSGTLYATAANITTLTAPHSGLTGLTTDDHTQYALLVGRSGGQTLTGGTAASNTLVLRSTTNATKGQVYVDETTASTSTTTGAFRVAGGVGIAGSLYAGNIYSNGVLVGSGSGSYTAGTNIDITGSVISVVNNPSFSGVVSITNTTASTSNTVGALVLSGGISVSNTTDATSSTDGGTFTSAGGMAVAKQLFIGTNAIISNYTQLSDITTPSNPSAGNYRVFFNTATNLLSSINSSGNLTTYQPITTKGDLVSYGTTTQERLPVGNDNDRLIADSTQTLGLRWVPSFIHFYIRDEKTAGTNGGTATGGNFNARTLNQITEYPTGNTTLTLSANIVTFAPGTYYVFARCPASGNVGAFTSRLFDTTNNITVALGSSTRSAANTANSESVISTTITLTASTTIALQMRVASTVATTGLGAANGFQTEVYAMMNVSVLQS